MHRKTKASMNSYISGNMHNSVGQFRVRTRDYSFYGFGLGVSWLDYYSSPSQRT